MKTKHLFVMLSFLLCIPSFTFAETQQEDKTKPTINLMEPRDGAIVKIGDGAGMHFDMELSDNVMLATYKLEVYENFGNFNPHRVDDSTVDYSFSKVYDVSGREKARVHHHEVQIPVNATPGHYHFIVTCTDAAGNESSVIRNIMLK